LGGTNYYRYARGNPITGVDPLGLDTLVYKGGVLTHYDSNGNVVGNYPATSGVPGVTDPSIPNQGPIPEGRYTVNPSEISPAGFFRRYLDPRDWGEYRVPAHPDAGTETFGRSGFFIHGGKDPGSAGCIDVGRGDKCAGSKNIEDRELLTATDPLQNITTFAYTPQGQLKTVTDPGTRTTTLAIDDVVARYTQAGARTYLSDALGSAFALAKDDQSIQAFYAYSPYGEAQVLGDDEGNPIQYTARENDQTGLYFYRARYYDPVLKRFISEDPIGTRAGPNFYKFVNNNPVLFTDPTGLICLYRQSTGRLVCYDYTTGWPPYVDTSGYSGAGAGRDNPNMQDVVDVGPIPQGCWRVGAPTGSRGTGPYSLPLTPLPDNDVFNTPRDPNSFLIHGPNASRPNDSSSGCPVIDRPSRQAIPTGEIFCVTP